jgi:dTMP kinase
MREATGTMSSRKRGSLIVFEGPDGVGKTTLVEAVRQRLESESTLATAGLAFPGRAPGTFGHHVYLLHHEPSQFGIDAIPQTSLQLLHVAAHLDAIDTHIRPRLDDGSVVLLDRYWWSTWVYGLVGGVPQHMLKAMIDLERMHWGEVRPDVVFLVQRAKAHHTGLARTQYDELLSHYLALATREVSTTRVVRLNNDRTVEHALEAIVPVLHQVGVLSDSI